VLQSKNYYANSTTNGVLMAETGFPLKFIEPIAAVPHDVPSGYKKFSIFV
jgi:hypothetical protein